MCAVLLSLDINFEAKFVAESLGSLAVWDWGCGVSNMSSAGDSSFCGLFLAETMPLLVFNIDAIGTPVSFF